MVRRQVRIFVAEGEQSAVIESNPEKTGIWLHSVEESSSDNSSFLLYLTYEEARTIARELHKYADEMESVK